MLDLDSDKIYTDMNLNDVTILKQALILLCQARFEADATHIKNVMVPGHQPGLEHRSSIP